MLLDVTANRASIALLGALLGLTGCSFEPEELTEGAKWVTQVAPPALAPFVSQYEHAQFFGGPNDPHEWKSVVRYTLRRDAPDPNAGCSFVGWIPGTWSADAFTLTVVTPSADSGSLEMHACPDGSPARTVPRPPHFVRAQSEY